MVDTKVFIVGATGETGTSIVNGLLEAGFTNLHALVRPASLEKPEVKSLKERGVQIHTGDLTSPVEDLVSLLKDVDTVISCVGPKQELSQIPLADAAKTAGVKRFVPTHFASVVPTGGIMVARDMKEKVLTHVQQLWLGYTVIEVGFWYQVSVPYVPSGKFNEFLVSAVAQPYLYGDGDQKTALGDVRDIGRWVARIIQDERTLNKYVLAYSEVMSQNELFRQVEEAAGEKIEPKRVSKEELKKQYDTAVENYNADPDNTENWFKLYTPQYSWSKFIRGDSTPEYAKYLGYLDATELYPDFKPLVLKGYLKELVDGTALQTYGGRY